MRGRATLAALLLLAAVAVPAAAAHADDAAIARLEAAAERHPDDPDIAWALARQLAQERRREQAVLRLESFVARWPTRHPEAALLLGRLLSELGRDAEALPHLERAVALDPASGPAHFHLALSLRRLGRADEAEEHLRAASELEPDLRAEAVLLRALTRLDLGDEEMGLRLLREAIDLDPKSEVAGSARLVLGEKPPPPWRERFRVESYAGMKYDSNVTLDNGDLPGLGQDRTDGANVWGTLVSVDALLGERYGLTLGARYDARNHLDLHRYDTHGFLGFFSARLHSGRRLSWRLDGLASHSLLDDRPYLSRGSLRPNLLVALGERAGVVRLFADLEGLWYDEDPLFPSLERDGFGFGGGLEHYVAIPGREGTWGAWRFDYRRMLTTAAPDLLGFEGDYDHDRYRGGIRAHLPLVWKLSADAGVTLGNERYHHENLVDFLTRLALGEVARPRRRRDWVLETQLRLVRPLTRHLDVEASWRFFERFSNTRAYAYDRTVAGVGFRVHLF